MKAIIGKYKTTKLFVLLTILLFGCSESFLDYDKRGATSPENFYKTDEQAREALMAVFNQWQSNAGWAYLYLHMGLSDESYAGGGLRGDNGGQLEELNEYRFNAATTAIKNHYSWLYYIVNRANLVINNVTDDTDNKKLYIAMAKALRAYSYFYLVNLWGDVPLVLEELSVNEYQQARTPKNEVLAQIETDLNEAIEVLPVRSALPPTYKNLISKGAAQSMLGKVYLFEEKYDEAATTLEEVIQSGEYDLYPDYTKIMRPESEFGVESVFELAFVNNMGYASYSFGSESNNFLYMLSPRITYFSCPASGVMPMWGFINPHKELYDAYTLAGDMVRRNANIISEADIIGLGGTLRNVGGSLPYGSDGYVRLKYVFYNGDGSASSQDGNNGTNVRMIRYADVLLMAAEAYNRKSVPDDTKAQDYVNLVRDRVSLPDISTAGNQLLEDIKLERKLELAFEGVRYLDLIRWGDAFDAMKDQGKVVPLGNGNVLELNDAGFKTGRNELLPIPEFEMTVNKNMTQNPGY